MYDFKHPNANPVGKSRGVASASASRVPGEDVQNIISSDRCARLVQEIQQNHPMLPFNRMNNFPNGMCLQMIRRMQSNLA